MNRASYVCHVNLCLCKSRSKSSISADNNGLAHGIISFENRSSWSFLNLLKNSYLEMRLPSGVQGVGLVVVEMMHRSSVVSGFGSSRSANFLVRSDNSIPTPL